MSSLDQAEAEIKEAIADFMKFLEDPPADALERSCKLGQHFVTLVKLYHNAPDTEPDTDADLGPEKKEGIHGKIGKVFPELGCYAYVEPVPDTKQEVTLGDAVMDLAELSEDLQDVVWVFDNVGPADAIWDFKFGYETHWGKHLHDCWRYILNQ